MKIRLEIDPDRKGLPAYRIPFRFGWKLLIAKQKRWVFVKRMEMLTGTKAFMGGEILQMKNFPWFKTWLFIAAAF